MKNLLKIVTEYIDEFSINRNITRQAAIIGGEGILTEGGRPGKDDQSDSIIEKI